jgi:hypothetical protein
MTLLNINLRYSVDDNITPGSRRRFGSLAKNELKGPPSRVQGLSGDRD